MKTLKRYCAILVLIVLVQSCSKKENQQVITAHNDLDIHRTFETVVLKKSELKKELQEDFERLNIEDFVSNKTLPIQYIDENNDGIKDALIFQPEIAPNQAKKLILSISDINRNKQAFDTVAFSRFVPERLDDFAWENDKVAFRMFGPKAEEVTKQGMPGGAFSSGVDCWLKRVEYPIINKWYKEHTNGTGDYHKDTGEGVDNFHVGASLGCGGVGVFKDSILFSSGNFSSFLEKESGLIQTSFELKYNPWDAGGNLVSEVKKISLDKGSHLTRHELIFDKEINGLVTGIPITEEGNDLTIDPETGWFSLWRSHEDSALGLAIVVDPIYISNHFEYHSQEKDQSHFFVQLKPIKKRVVYYAGFGWKKSEAFNTKEEWNAYLKQFSRQLKSPIRLTIN